MCHCWIQLPVAGGQWSVKFVFLLLLARLLACGRLCSRLGFRLRDFARTCRARALHVRVSAFGLCFMDAERRHGSLFAVELDAGDADGGELLAMSDQLLVLLLALALE